MVIVIHKFWVRVTAIKPVSVTGYGFKKVYGDDTRIEAGSSKLEARIPSFYVQASI